MFAKLRAILVLRRTPKTQSEGVTSYTREPVSHKAANTTFLRFSIKEQVLFAKRLSFLARAGVSMIESMTLIRNQTKSRRKQKMFDTIIRDITAGQYLSNAMLPYRQLFGDFTINIVRVGENAGTLSDNLIYLANELGKKQALQRKVRGALVYPVFISVATLGVTGLLTVYIFPKIMPIFSSLNIQLPLTTRILLAVSNYLKDWGILTILGVIAFGLLFAVVRNLVPPFRKATDYLALKMPIVGPMMRAYNAANFCRTLGTLIHSGIPISEGMRTTAEITKNLVFKDAYLKAAEAIQRGERISQTLASYKSIFPDMLAHMVMIGETTGSLSQTLGYLSDLYEAEVDEATKNLSNSIEPILLMTMGILVGLIAISVITPIYEVTKSIDNLK